MKKYIFFLFAIVAAVTFTACSSEDDNTTNAELLNAEQVYFPNTIASTIEITAQASTVEIPVMRMGDDATTIPMQVTMGEENLLELVAPASVAFSAGEKKSTIVISYNPEKVEPGHYDNVTLSFGDEYSTPYGNSTVALKIGQAEPWVSLGMGTLIDNWVFGDESPVEILQNQLYPNRFRVVNPFKEIALNNESEPADGFTEFWDITVLKKGDVYAGEEIQDDDIVVYNDCNSGYFNDSYGADIYVVHPSGFSSLTYADWLNNRVTMYQEDGKPAVINIAPMFYMFGVGGWNYTDSNGAVLITFPGVVLADYSCEATYAGKFEATDGTVYATANVELGADVASAKATVVAGRNAEPGLMGILDGTLDNITEFTTSSEVRVAMPANAESGVYSFVVVTYSADGEAQDYNSTTFNYSASGEVAETWTLSFYGTFAYKSVFGNADGSPYLDENLPFYESDTNPNRFKISDVFYGVDFIFEMDPETGELTFEDQYTGYTDPNDGDLMVTDMHALYPGSFPTPSRYSGGVFHFNTGYYANDGWWGYDQSDDNTDLETFTLTAEAGDSQAKAKKAPARAKRKPVSKKLGNKIRPAKYTVK